MEILIRTYSALVRGPWRRGAAAALVAALLWTLCIAQPATAQRGAELDELKAAFVYQFGNFVQWPNDAFESPEAPLVICIVGNDAMADMLTQSTRNKTLNGHPIHVVKVDPGDKLPASHIVFLDASEYRQSQDLLDKLDAQPVLTVGDDDDFIRDGGVIRLYKQGSKLRIEINVEAADRAGLKISSKLLSLARVVHGASDDRNESGA